MAAYLLDTTTFSLMVKRQSGVRTRVASLPAADRMAICSVVRGEVLYGLDRMPHGKRRQDLEAKVTELFAALPCEPIPEAAADEYALIKRETERKGARLDENDLWIAATALSLGAALVTTDSDFSRTSAACAWKYFFRRGLRVWMANGGAHAGSGSPNQAAGA